MKSYAVDRAGPVILTFLNRLEAALDLRLLKRADRLERVVMQDWIAYRSAATGLAFAELRPRRHHIEVFILPAPSDLGFLGREISPVPKTRGWGWFRGRFILGAESNLETPLRLMDASYDYSVRRPRSISSERRKTSHRGVGPEPTRARIPGGKESPPQTHEGIPEGSLEGRSPREARTKGRPPLTLSRPLSHLKTQAAVGGLRGALGP